MADGANIDAMSLQFSSVNSRPCPSDRFVMCFLGTRGASVQLIVTALYHTALDTMPLADGLGSTLEKTATLLCRSGTPFEVSCKAEELGLKWQQGGPPKPKR
jgi:hypothetical protein